MLRITITTLALCASLCACAQKYPDQRPADADVDKEKGTCLSVCLVSGRATSQLFGFCTFFSNGYNK